MKRSVAFNMVVRVTEEVESARFGISIVTEQWHLYMASATTRDGDRISHGDMIRCGANLDLTYILRAFAAFESILRDFWLNGMRRTTDPPIGALMDGVAAYRRMDAPTLASAHQVRDFRNLVMHRDQLTPKADFSEVVRSLGKFLSWLSTRW